MPTRRRGTRAVAVVLEAGVGVDAPNFSERSDDFFCVLGRVLDLIRVVGGTQVRGRRETASHHQKSANKRGPRRVDGSRPSQGSERDERRRTVNCMY